MSKTFSAVLTVFSLLIGATFGTTVKTLNHIVFADQFCNTPGVQDQSCIVNAVSSLPISGGSSSFLTA